MNGQRSNIKNHLLILAAGTSVLLAGCAAPDPRPFQEYAAAVEQAGSSLDGALVQATAWGKDDYEESLLTGRVKIRDSAILNHPAPFTVAFPGADAPPYYKLQDVRLTLLAINEATQKYVNLLAQLAGSDFVNPDTFEAMAKDTDASLNSIVKTLDAKVPGAAIPVFSVASSEVAQMIVEHKRQEALTKLLKQGQPGIEAYCQKCITLLHILDQSLNKDYEAKTQLIDENFDKAKPNARAQIDQLLQINSDYLSLIQALTVANKIYETLPTGHQDLLKAIQKSPTDFAAVKQLFEEGQRLKRIYDEIRPQPAASTTKGS
jgi:hypothetical protein